MDISRKYNQIRRGISNELEERKERRRQRLLNSSSYKICKTLSTVMDGYFLDPILGFFVPGVTDILLQTLTLPFIYMSLFKIGSIPLTLAVIFNACVDMLVGLFPIVGDIADIFVRSYKKSYRMIVGYIEEDEEVMSEVRSRAWLCGIMIIVLGFIIYWVMSSLASLFSSIF